MARTSVKHISAGDLEKYCYCPLSWWLSDEEDSESERLAQGIKGHEKLGRSLWRIDSGERTASQSERLVFWWAVAATIIAIIGLELLPFENTVTISQILGVAALFWILAASFFLYMASKSTMHSKVLDYERIILVFAIGAAIVAVNAVAFSITDVRLAVSLETTALVWLIGASYFLHRSLKSSEIADSLRKEFRVQGRIEYIDIDDSKAFKSDAYGLSGRPDYIIKVGDKLIPVEEKTGRTPKGPLFSHIIQIAAYCLLMEETSGKAPPYGLLKYPEHEHEIEYNEDLKKLLLEKLAEMRTIVKTEVAHRNHNRPGKCKNCSRRDICPERLS
jgi:CRISPR-associated exonuclease Cas4